MLSILSNSCLTIVFTIRHRTDSGFQRRQNSSVSLRSSFNWVSFNPSNSPWGAPVLFARKADETLCLYIDYRGLNRYTVKNIYPMPRVDELFDRLADNRFFTKIDLRSDYHQIRVSTEDQPKTAFRSHFGHYEFTVMPFGLTNAPATFQTAMDDIFRDILEEYVLVYLDDILQRLRKHGFYAKLSKCRFAQRKVDFLGHHVFDQGLHMDDAKITAIVEWPVPTSVKQLRSFLDLTSYYSNFIQGYARRVRRTRYQREKRRRKEEKDAVEEEGQEDNAAEEVAEEEGHGIEVGVNREEEEEEVTDNRREDEEEQVCAAGVTTAGIRFRPPALGPAIGCGKK
ncbi:hypothetical protein CBR_g23668 [Chara braunii]|uniref:Reverse transcriptase domain-containing protein n=1 Tax=Chara braunii TaxID=69332 RepID=A0A388L4W2_CHABU|nr:hypothetical protein CBR_g23668 [Chara braunii]|eukprot:GBG77337.1 hypothetical protein CBR_g23668 [Chara braunii]